MNKILKLIYIIALSSILFSFTSCKSSSASKKNKSKAAVANNPNTFMAKDNEESEATKDLEEQLNNAENNKDANDNTANDNDQNLAENKEPTADEDVVDMANATQEEVPFEEVVAEEVPNEELATTEEVASEEPPVEETELETETTDETLTEELEEPTNNEEDTTTPADGQLEIDAIQETPPIVPVVPIVPAIETTTQTDSVNEETVPAENVENLENLPMASATPAISAVKPMDDKGVIVNGGLEQENALNSSKATNPEAITEPVISDVELPIIEINVASGSDARVELDGDDWFVASSDIDKNLTYKGRDYSIEDKSVFTFMTGENGEYTLTFNRNTANSLEVQVVKVKVGINNEEVNNNLPTTNADASDTVLPNLDTVDVKTLDSKTLKSYFKQELDKGNLVSAESLLKVLKDKEPKSKDVAEMLYLLGQKYEANDKNRNIETAYKYYKEVYDNYPISRFSSKSKDRMDYLDRFYFKVP